MKEKNIVIFSLMCLVAILVLSWTTQTAAVNKTIAVVPVNARENNDTAKEKVINISHSKKTLDKINALSIEIEDLAEDEATTNAESEIPAKVAYLTFDDGPSENTVKILDILQEQNIKATFFVLGKTQQDEVYKRIVDEGHTIALHSNTHEYSDIYRTTDAFLEDIAILKQLILDITGYTPEILRFPGGSNNTVSHRYGGVDIMEEIITAVEESGYIYFDWNVDSLDASKGVQDKEIIVNAVLKQSSALDQAVILMHDSRYKTTTVEALPEIIDGLKNMGFAFDRLTSDTMIVQF
ncbi:MAG: hypothetical protein BEN19_03105 [Epulopiscium sp. Nuni2H_MBin003]|nr:MAG: hypothetical protein BEN19_03105 [Epulopiscium sp. Nuni2H_MBin003]